MYCIRNKKTGIYIMRRINEPMKFCNEGDAWQYIRINNLSKALYEVVKLKK